MVQTPRSPLLYRDRGRCASNPPPSFTQPREGARALAPGGRLALEITNRAAWDHRILPPARRLMRRPVPAAESLPFGSGTWHDVEGSHLWVWHADIGAITDHLATRGLQRVHRGPAEFTDAHWKIGGWPGRVLMHVNNAWFRLGLPAAPAATNLLVFEKPGPTT